MESEGSSGSPTRRSEGTSNSSSSAKNRKNSFPVSIEAANLARTIKSAELNGVDPEALLKLCQVVRERIFELSKDTSALVVSDLLVATEARATKITDPSTSIAAALSYSGTEVPSGEEKVRHWRCDFQPQSPALLDQ